ncbi:MAG: 30S ribosomal protein S11 [Candidatus Riflebacteria bacterium RBG_13_59_9]|nr:MAG: 30S ribosomal protein S11 [Candidatus Riflebacteria bacterium RBG_13_59_9]
MVKGKPKARKKRVKRNVVEGCIYVRSSFNNTLVTVTDLEGNALAWATAGTRGFKGTKKGTAYAAQLAAEDACRQAKDLGMREVTIYTKGPGSGKEAAIRIINGQGLRIKLIRDVTTVPHNGCRPRKRRRV